MVLKNKSRCRNATDLMEDYILMVNKNQPDHRQDEKLDVDLDFMGLFHARV